MKINCDLLFTPEHMAQLELAIKALRRSPNGLSGKQADSLARSLERLKESVMAEGAPTGPRPIAFRDLLNPPPGA